MKSPFLRTLALPVLCWLALLPAQAEEVTISLGMPFDQVIEALQKCGAQDVAYSPQVSGLCWRLESYNIQVALGQHYGKLDHLKYSAAEAFNPNDFLNSGNGQSVRSLKFDTDKKTFKAEDLPPAPAPLVKEGHWIVRTEMLLVAMSPEKALALLPDLRDEGKVDAACGQIMAAIQHKEAELIGYPVIYANTGQKVTAETIFEKIYPTQFETPQTVSAGHPNEGSRDPVPTAFEKRNAGVTLEIEPVVSPDGKSIDVILQSQHVEFDGMDAYKFQQGPDASGKIEQPRFYTSKESFSATIRNGQRVLIGVHKSLRADEIEIHILQMTATQIP